MEDLISGDEIRAVAAMIRVLVPLQKTINESVPEGKLRFQSMLAPHRMEAAAKDAENLADCVDWLKKNLKEA